MNPKCVNLSLKQLQSEGEKLAQIPEVSVTVVPRCKSASILLQTPTQMEEVNSHSSFIGG
jgi:hypothetical protein